MTITIADGRGALWQWDTGRKVKITDGDGVKQIHYQNRCFGRSVDVGVGADGTAIIPDELLQDWHTLTAYAYVTDDTGAYTMVQQDFVVHKRARPADYVYTPTEHTGFERLRAEIGDLSALQTDAKDTLVAAINEAAASGGGAGSMDLRVTDGYIQYSKDGGSTWQNLIAVAELKGDKGNPGTPGAAGTPGKDGAGMDITGATVGQIAKITAVDSDGKPTAWSPVDMPSGGGGGSAGDAAPEILADVTTDEDAAAVTLDGFSAYKVSLLIIMTAAESNKNITVMLNRDLWASKGWNGNAVIPTVANVANYLFAYDSICNGVIKITTRKSNWGQEFENPKQAINTTGITGTLWNGAAIQKLTVMIDYGNTMIPAGTRFIVWKG